MKHIEIFTIGYRRLKIKWQDEIIEDETECFGYHEEDNGIKVATKYDEDIQRAALLHEILHAISVYGALEFRENQIKALGNILFDVMQDNKLLFRELLK